MKTVKYILTLLLCVCLLGSLIPQARAAEIADATVDYDRLSSLTLYKYDFTNAAKDGVWNQESYVSTGLYDPVVNGALGAGSVNNLGNGEASNGYAIKGVEFTYLKVADLYEYESKGTVENLYKMDKKLAADLLNAIGLSGGARSHADANALDDSCWFYRADILNSALHTSLQANATTVKNALETYIAANGGTQMPLTDENGFSKAADLPVGLYLLVETKVPEMVTDTTAPFLISLPMTSVNGGANGEVTTGGHDWIYDVTVYPKNQSGIVTLEKTIREAKKDTGKNNGTDAILDGFTHNATASAGDTLEYQIVSTLPTITSKATAISAYTFKDILSAGLSYDSDTPVIIQWYTDAACTDLVTTWKEDSGKFSVNKEANTDGSSTMTISMTEDGLADINAVNTDANNSNGKLYAGFSNYTLRISYAANVNGAQDLVYGDNGNCNEVVLTWSRSSNDYYDTLVDDAHVYTYGINLTKVFSDEKTDQKLFDHVLFKVRNNTDGYYVKASLNEAEGIWYVTGHTDKEEEATALHPVEWNKKPGQIVIKGLEDDEYILTETETANGYVLLYKNIRVNISVKDDTERPCDVYAGDILGVVQNDSRYAYDGDLDLSLANIPQTALSHNYLSASATVNKQNVEMLADDVDTDSENALVPLTVINTRGYNLPATGDASHYLLTVMAVVCAVSAVALIILLVMKLKKKNK